MRILVHEFASGGGLAGQAVPPSLAREGAAMRDALVEDLAASGCHAIRTTVDPRFPLCPPPGVEAVPWTYPDGLDALLAAADAVWFVAPETGRCLERLSSRAVQSGVAVIGSTPEAIRRASDKSGLARRLAPHGLSCPESRVLGPEADVLRRRTEVAFGYPLVVKPRLGAGCEGVCLARGDDELAAAVAAARQVSGNGDVLLQRFVPGVPVSVSLLASEDRSVALAVNAQNVEAGRPFSYRGGVTPFEHPLAERAVATARQAVSAIGGLGGYVGVDLVLTDSDAVVIEVNPRLTTSYLGVRSALEDNVAELALAASSGTLPTAVALGRKVRFTSAGGIVSARPAARAVAATGP